MTRNFEQKKKCVSCKDDPGKCSNCRGTGKEPGIKAAPPCHVCKGNGLCQACGGKGWV